jgi:hypothetical protein
MTKNAIVSLGLLAALAAGCDQNQDVGNNVDAGQPTDAGNDLAHAGPATDMAMADTDKRVFVSSLIYKGDLKTAGGGATGLEGGDKICQHLADAAVLGGTWKAWLSDANTNAIDRISEGPWHTFEFVRDSGGTITGVYINKVFNNKANMTTVPLASINMTEFGREVSSSGEGSITFVWTGTTGAATPAQETCANWTSSDASDEGIMGVPSSVAVAWTDDPEWGAAHGDQTAPRPCNEPHHIYCFEQ